MATTGECRLCGDHNLLDPQGLCTTCHSLPACKVHSQRFAAGRCLLCSKPVCAGCLGHGVCRSCMVRSKRRPQRKRAPSRLGAVLRADRRMWVAGVLIGVLAVRLAMLALHEEPLPPLSEDQQQVHTLTEVAKTIEAMRQQQGVLPRNASEIMRYMKKHGAPQIPLIVEADRPLSPKLVRYEREGDIFTLSMTDQAGQLVMRRNRPLGYASQD